MTPAVTPDDSKMSLDDFAGSIKAKYPGAYDHLENQELANRVLAKYPVYRQHVDLTPPSTAPEAAWKSNPAIRFFNSVGAGVLGAPAAIVHTITNPKESLVDPVVNAAKDYAGGKVSMKGALSVLPEALGQGTAAAIMPELTRGAFSAAKEIPMPTELGAKAKAIGAVGAQHAISKIPVVGNLVRRPSVGDYIQAVRTPGARGIPPSEGLPEVAAAQSDTAGHLQKVVADDAEMRSGAAGKLPRSEGTEEMEALRPETEGKLRSVVGQQAPAINTSRANVGQLLNKATDAQPLTRGIPLKDQAASSVIDSHSYNPAVREMTVSTKNGSQYVHGDVSPEQAQAFEQAESKGKAWNELRNNSTLVAKIVDGKRVAIKPPKAIQSASPNDLTPILEESLRKAKDKK